MSRDRLMMREDPSLSNQATWCQVISKTQKGPKLVAATLIWVDLAVEKVQWSPDGISGGQESPQNKA